jgi:opacity protein-like surface antigen
MKPQTTTAEIEFAAPPVAAAIVVPDVPAVRSDQPFAPPPANLAPDAAAIFQIIARAASDPAVDIDKMERLIAMQERMQAKAARLDYDNAMSTAQTGMKAVRADSSNPSTKSMYASYAALDKAIRPTYSANGFALSFDTAEGAPDNCVRIVCKIAHRGGHREVHHIDMPADGKGARGNDVMTRTHATGAAITYGKRYLLGMIFNIAIGEDDDGNGASYDDGDVERLASKDAPRDENGKLLSTYAVNKGRRAKDFADKGIETLNLSPNRQAAKDWWHEQGQIPEGKRQSPLDWLRDNSHDQFMRLQTAYENVVGLK